MQLEHGKIEDLDSNEIDTFLREHSFAHLGCQSKGEVYVVPIIYTFDDGNIYCYSKDGKKIDMMKNNPNVCVQVDVIDDMFHWKSVIAWGNFEVLEGSDAIKGIRLLNQQLLRETKITETSDLTPEFERLFSEAIIFRIRVRKSTGRFES